MFVKPIGCSGTGVSDDPRRRRSVDYCPTCCKCIGEICMSTFIGCIFGGLAAVALTAILTYTIYNMKKAANIATDITELS